MKTKEQRQERRLRIKRKFKEFFRKIKAWLKGFNEEILPKISATALKVTQEIKKILDSEVIDVITKLTPTDMDDEVAIKVRGALSVVVDRLNIWDSCIKENATLEEKLKCFLLNLKDAPKSVQDAYKAQIHALLLELLDDSKKTSSEYALYAQMDYLNYKIS